MLQRIRNYIIDSYNGLYKIVLEPSMPTKQTIILLVLGIFLGMVWAYGCSPTVYYNGSPHQLNPTAREQWVIMAGAAAQRGYYDDTGIRDLLQQVENPSTTIQNAINSASSPTVQQDLQQILPLAGELTGTPAPSNQGFFASLMSFVLPIVLVVVVTPILVVVWRLLIYPNIVAGAIHQVRMRRNTEYREQRMKEAADRQRIQKAREAEKAMVAEVDEELGEPVTQKMSIYTKGRNYDDSFAIEDANDMFLGEFGASIAKSTDDGDPTAIEVWLFDKEDFTRTLTTILMTPHAFNDPATRAQLEVRVENPATDLVQIQAGGKFKMETDKIRVQANVTDLAFITDGSAPPNSAIENLTLELSAWQRDPDAPPPPGVRPMTTAAPGVAGFGSPPPAASPPPQPLQPQQMQPLTPPPLQQPPAYGGQLQAQPLQPPPPPPMGTGLQPLTPPPLQMPSDDDDDDDPFGGTGDFTPLSPNR